MSTDRISSTAKHAASASVVKLLWWWIPTIQVPLIAFVLGKLASQSPMLAAVAVAICIFEVVVAPAGPLHIVTSLIAYFYFDQMWFAIFLISLWWLFYAESRINYLHTKKQIEDLFSDILDGKRFRIQEVELEDKILSQFPSYKTKLADIRMAVVLEERMKEHIPTARSKPFRVFRYSTIDVAAITSAAAAFPLQRYASLIFVRNDIRDVGSLNDAQRFQLYHELAHGTPEGISTFLRPLRWVVLNPVASAMTAVLIIGGGLGFLKGFQSAVAWGLGCLVFAALMRSSGEYNYMKLKGGPREAMADSIALSHEYFQENGKWRKRAETLKKKFEDEWMNASPDEAGWAESFYRGVMMNRWIRRNEVGPYFSQDSSVQVFVAFWAYAAAGWILNISGAVGNFIYFGSLAAVAVMSLVVGSHGWKNLEHLRKVDAALPRKPT